MPKFRLSHIKNSKLSLYRGVDLTKKGWMTSIHINKELYKFGPFKSESLAAKKYDTMALKYFKEKARLNILKNPFSVKSIQMKIKKIKTKNNDAKIEKRIKFSIVTKHKICYRQKWRCNMCNNLLPDIFIVDHIIPLFLGGPNAEYNLQALCPSCNQFKTSILDYQLIKPLAQIQKITVDDVFKIQRDNLHRALCVDPATLSTINNTETMNINCQQYITNSHVNSTASGGITLEQSGKELELNVNGVKIKILV